MTEKLPYKPDESDRDALRTAMIMGVRFTRGEDDTWAWHYDGDRRGAGFFESQYHAARHAIVRV